VDNINQYSKISTNKYAETQKVVMTIIIKKYNGINFCIKRYSIWMYAFEHYVYVEISKH